MLQQAEVFHGCLLHTMIKIVFLTIIAHVLESYLMFFFLLGRFAMRFAVQER
jgi:hypothetical protein